jgi:glutathione S-transferase
MKLYYFPVAPNPTKVLVYLKEKGIELDMQLVNLPQGEQNSPEHLARNPRGALPVLELDNGEYLTESLPIIEYLEELYPQPSMIGATPEERAHTRAFERQVEMGVMNPIARYVHATNSPLGLPPRPEVAAAEWERLEAALPRVDEQIGDSPFATGEAPSIVDCTLFAALLFGEMFGTTIPEHLGNIQRWKKAFFERPSAQL